MSRHIKYELLVPRLYNIYIFTYQNIHIDKEFNNPCNHVHIYIHIIYIHHIHNIHILLVHIHGIFLDILILRDLDPGGHQERGRRERRVQLEE